MKLVWFECCRLSFLFGIVEGDVTPFSCADANGVFDGNDEDTAVADFAGLCCFDNSLYCLFHILVAYNNRDKDAFVTSSNLVLRMIASIFFIP